MVQILGDINAFAGRQFDLGACGNGVCPAVGADAHLGFVVNGFVGEGVVYPDQHIAAAPVDDILGLEPVEVVGGILALLQIQQLFRIDLGVLAVKAAAAVADGDEGEAHFIKIAHAVIRNIPAQAAVPDLVILPALFFPLLGRKMAKRRQIAVVPLAHGFQLPKGLIDLRTLHGMLSLCLILPPLYHRTSPFAIVPVIF